MVGLIIFFLERKLELLNNVNISQVWSYIHTATFDMERWAVLSTRHRKVLGLMCGDLCRDQPILLSQRRRGY